LEQNYPNPFNPSTLIRYRLADAGKVNLTVYNSLGQKVKTLVNKIQNAGLHEVKFDGGSLPSGIYFCSLKQGQHEAKIKMILLK
ncbi:T9SS C-terminal target domain-containing protein, partial [candidate division KSB1 bacterium]